MKLDIEQLPENTDLLKEIILDLQRQLVESKDRYQSLIEQIRLAKQQRFSSSSEKNIYQTDMFDEPGTEITEAVKDEIDDTISVASHQRKRHPVRKPLPGDLPREVIIHDISAIEKVCHCGTPLIQIGEETTEQLKFVPAKLSVVRHVRYKYACKPCQENVKIAPMPRLLLPKSIASPELMAHIIVSKYTDHIPLHRQESIWKRLNVEMPRSSLSGWTLKVAELCEPLVKLLQQDIVTHDYTQADETPVQVLKEAGRNNETKSFMWVYRGGKSGKSIVFDYQETRSGAHARAFLQGFRGYLQTDAYSGYAWAEHEENLVPIGCMAHARRNFTNCAKLSKNDNLAKQALDYFAKLYAIEKHARENNYSPSERFEYRKAHAPPILTEFRQWLEHYLTKTPAQHKIGQSIQYTLRHWANLTNYLKDGRVEIDNNIIENAIRPFAVGRKNFLFMGSPRGAKAGAILYSLIMTCKANSIDPYQYFSAMLHQLRNCSSDDDYKKLLPQFIRL